MQRIDPRPEPSQQSNTPPQQQQQSQQSQAQQQQQGQGQAQQFMPTGFASTGANPHTQSFEEIYGIPENFLEIEVRSSCCWSEKEHASSVSESAYERGKHTGLETRNAHKTRQDTYLDKSTLN
jgi:hypothetical protein